MGPLLVIIIGWGIIIGGSWFLTKKFKERFPLYKGTILWTLITFPIIFSLPELGMIFSPFVGYNSIGIGVKIILSIVFAGCLIFDLYLLYNNYWIMKDLDETKLPQLQRNITIIFIIYGITFLIGIIAFQDNGNDSFIRLILYIAILLGVVYYFTKRRIEYFRKLLSGELENSSVDSKQVSLANTIITDNYQKQETAKEKLYKLKNLLDQGILTQEEFDSMKKDILEKGI